MLKLIKDNYVKLFVEPLELPIKKEFRGCIFKKITKESKLTEEKVKEILMNNDVYDT